MLKFIEFVRSRPSDGTIRIIRLIFGILLTTIIIFDFTGFEVQIGSYLFPVWTKYILCIIPVISIIRGAIDPGIFRKKIWKWTQISLAIFMILVGSIFLEDTTKEASGVVNTTTSGSLSIKDLNISNTPTSTEISAPFWYILFGWLLLIAGISGKNITKKREKYGEKIKKIRV